jgi:hypothetical protein
MKTFAKIFLTLALATSSVFATDGHSGSGGYTCEEGHSGSGGYVCEGHSGSGGFAEDGHSGSGGYAGDGHSGSGGYTKEEDAEDSSFMNFIDMFWEMF